MTYHNTVCSQLTTDPDFYLRLLIAANWALMLSALSLGVTVLFSYPLADLLTIKLQIVAHISTIIAATILKISYVLRCIALNSLGREVC